MHILFLAIPALIFFPSLLTANFAKRMGRSYKTWFLIGLVLPFIANFILFFLKDKSPEQH